MLWAACGLRVGCVPVGKLNCLTRQLSPDSDERPRPLGEFVVEVSAEDCGIYVDA